MLSIFPCACWPSVYFFVWKKKKNSSGSPAAFFQVVLFEAPKKISVRLMSKSAHTACVLFQEFYSFSTRLKSLIPVEFIFVDGVMNEESSWSRMCDSSRVPVYLNCEVWACSSLPPSVLIRLLVFRVCSEYVQSNLPVSVESRLGKIQYIISSKADTFNLHFW